MRKITKKIIALVLTVFMISAMLPMGVFAAEAAEETEYVLYPIPHTVSYASGSYELKNINVVYGSGMDDATKARLNETAELRGLTVTEGTAGDSSKTNIYVAINGSGDDVENYIITNYDNDGAIQSDLFTKTDAYFLASDNGEIVVLGKDVDSCFYGLTTLYQIFGQLESNSLRNFTINDYADVASRGFIEGYYGNPWSTQDRINLMTWGGYYKLNSYFYAPKDDPKHNAKWRELYTDEEIATLIKPLADAGNASKCRFVYALHPYMYNPITDSNYNESMAVMKAKFMQVIDAGVRQIAILADDAGNQGGTHYTRMLTDMTAWINELRQQEKYADLKLLLPFVTQEYMYFGQSYYRNFPENVQIVMTGGQVWGFCSPSFTNTFYNNVGRGAYLWINWPCTDNSKNHLIMGGYSDFLQVGVDPNKVEGIVLNPMQQSEPSKVAIFGNACYTWNIWETEEEADAAWETSFACVDHNTVVPNEASDALKELSKHMIDQTRFEDNPNVLEESVVLREELSAFTNKLNAGTYTEEDIDSLIEEFTILQNAAKVYREQGHEDIKAQIEPWLGNWDDTTLAIISYLNSLKAVLKDEGDAAIWGNYAIGQAAFASSKNHPLWYLDHYEYAESGYRFIVPFMKALDTYLADYVLDIVDPSGSLSSGGSTGGNPGGAVTGMTAFEGNNPGHYSGSLSNLVDGSTSTTLWYNDYARVGQYVGVDLGRPVIIGNVTFTQDSGDHFTDYTLQYSTDGVTYHDYRDYSDTVLNVDLSGSGIEARYLRFYSNSTTSTWVKICEIAVTEAAATTVVTNNATLASWQTRIGAESAQLVTTGSLTLAPNEYLGMDLRRIKDLTSVVATEKGALTLEVSKNNVDWVAVESGATEEDARYVRLINKTDAAVTVNLSEFTVTSREVAEPSLYESNIGVNSSWGVSEDCRENGAAFDGDVGTNTEFADFVTTGQYIIYDLGQVRDIWKLELYSADSAVNYIRDAKVQVSNDLTTWVDVIEIGDGVENTGESGVKCIDSDAGYSQATSSYPNYVSVEGTIEATAARYIRIIMTAPNNERAVLFAEIEINEGEYVSATNDPTFVTSAIEVQGHVPQNMIDGDLTTSWKPDTTDAGSMVYTFSDKLDINRIHIVQQSASNAKVSLYVENDGAREWVDMGTLDESLVKLECDNDLNLALKIEWTEGNVPTITEIVRFSTEPTEEPEPDTQGTKIELEVGESKTVRVNGNLTNADVSGVDETVATVTLTGIANSTTQSASAAVSELVSGKQYLLVNTRARKTVLNTSSSTSETADGNMAGLALNGSTSNFTDAAIWTITATDTANVYNVQSSNGKYMTIGANAGGLSDAAQPITIVYANGNWTLMQNGAYLNDAGGLGTTASGWQNTAAATDAGSQFTIHEVVNNDVIGATDITFTGVAAGKTSVEIGGVLYEITVNGEDVGGECEHTYGEPVFTWAEDYSEAIATFTCTKDATHTHTEDAVITSESAAPDCTSPATVTYTATVTFDGVTYTDEKVIEGEAGSGAHNYVNGFCTGCDGYEEAKLNANGVYEIANGGQLYWFAEHVRGDADADAILVADIFVNETLNDDSRVWNTIGYKDSNRDYVYYNGTFDGQGHSVSGLYYNQDKTFADQYIGLFGVIGEEGVVKNIDLENTYFWGRYWVGGIAGQNFGTIEGCTSDATVYVDEQNCVGGIAGENLGLIENCSNTGDVFGNQEVGGIVGSNRGDIIDCTNSGTISYTDEHGSYVGGIAGSHHGQATITNCYNTGDVTGKSSMGGIGGIVGHVDLTSSYVTISHCYNTGNITGDCAVGGIVGRVEDGIVDIDDCYNTGDITAKFGQKATFAGGIAGRIETAESTIDDCHNVGTVKASRLAGGIIGGEGPVITNCYYLAGCASDSTTTQYGVGALNPGQTTADTEATVAATADEFASGDITWLLNHETAEGDLVWFQTVGTDAYPHFDGDITVKPEGEVIRLAGANRYATALMAADEMKAALGTEKFDAIIIASGNDFADALAGSYLATVKNAPILLSYGGTSEKYAYLDTDNIDYVKANLAEGGVVYILGGKNAVPELYETGLEGYDVVRLGGANRFETNIMILEEAGIANGAEVLVCTATNFADSLSASATGMPILLVWNEKSILYGNQPEFLAGLKEKGCTFTILGGESAVSAKLAETIAAYGEVDRLAGKNRMETSVLVAEKYFDAPETAVVAYAWNYPDGLCGGSLAYSLGAPLILTMPKYEAAAVEYAAENEITTGYVLGGEKLVTDEIVRSIFAMDATDDIIVKN